MKRSIDRILTAYVGNLLGANDLLETIRAKPSGRPCDHQAYAWSGFADEHVDEFGRRFVVAYGEEPDRPAIDVLPRRVSTTRATSVCSPLTARDQRGLVASRILRDLDE
jgi:hypothetical protein